MKDICELPELMLQFVGDAKLENDHVVFGLTARKTITEVAAYARKTKIYAESREESERFWKEEGHEKTIEIVHGHMLDRIVHAPTVIHRDSSVLTLMPELEDLLIEEEKKNADCKVRLGEAGGEAVLELQS